MESTVRQYLEEVYADDGKTYKKRTIDDMVVENIYNPLEIEEFFNEKEIEEFKSEWSNLENYLLENLYNTDRSETKLTVCHSANGFVTGTTLLNKAGQHWGFNEANLLEASIFKEWLKELEDKLKKKLKAIDRKVGAITVNIFNFHKSFEVHCDSIDLPEKLKHMRRGEEVEIEVKRLMSTSKHTSYIPTHQGLININAPSNQGTILFDQSFPISVYCDYGKTGQSNWSTGWGPYKEVIQFYKGDEPERYGYKIKNFTSEAMPIEQYEQITSLNKAWKKSSAYGLTLDRELLFGNPGKLNSWDRKSFHMPKPMPYLKPAEAFNNNRLCLQYEAYGA